MVNVWIVPPMRLAVHGNRASFWRSPELKVSCDLAEPAKFGEVLGAGLSMNAKIMKIPEEEPAPPARQLDPPLRRVPEQPVGVWSLPASAGPGPEPEDAGREHEDLLGLEIILGALLGPPIPDRVDAGREDPAELDDEDPPERDEPWLDEPVNFFPERVEPEEHEEWNVNYISGCGGAAILMI
jgi:hypothetical protein